MLKHLAPALVLVGGLALPAAADPAPANAAAPQAPAPSLLDGLVPPGASLELRGREDGPAGTKAAGAILRAQSVEIGMVGLSMRHLEDGRYLLSLERATVMPRLASAPRMSVTGLAMVLEQPIREDDPVCAWLDAVSTLALDAVQIDRSVGEADWISALGRDLEWRSAGQGGCSLGGRLSAGEFTARQPDERIHTVSGLEIRAWLPGSPEAAAALPGPAHLEAKIEEIEISRAGEVPTLGASGARLVLDAQMPTLAAPAALMRAANPFRYHWPGAALAMQAYNSGLAAEADLHLSASAIRIYSAGVMPAHLIRNFGRAGLSTISGGITADLALRRGLGRFRQSLELTGVGIQKLQAEFDAKPFGPEKIDYAMSDVELGLHGVPDIDIMSAVLEVVDLGFAAAIREVTGMPLTSNITSPSVLALLSSTSSEGTFSEVSAALRHFAREVATGDAVQVAVLPAQNRTVLQFLSRIFSDPHGLPVHMLVKREAQ